MPTRAKGKRYPIEVSAVAWMDLLGYGSMLKNVEFNPSHIEAHNAVKRLEDFQRKAAMQTTRHLKALIVNDGVAFVRELSPRTHSVTYDFLKRVYEAFWSVNTSEQKNGYPGTRMIVAVGPRLRMNGTIRYAKGHLKNIIKRMNDKQLTPEQAVREAFNSFPLTNSTPQLQANFAFTKAYLADEAGSKNGFDGANFFVESTMFDSNLPNWIVHDKNVSWAAMGMSSQFLRLTKINYDKANSVHQKGILNAAEIAKKLGITY